VPLKARPSRKSIPWSNVVLKDIVDVQPLDGYRLKLRFEDGVEGVVDVAQLVPFTGVFAALCDRNEFLAVRVDRELGTICWPGGADLDLDVLYSVVTRRPIPQYEAAAKAEQV
jgi:hypothetical protein